GRGGPGRILEPPGQAQAWGATFRDDDVRGTAVERVDDQQIDASSTARRCGDGSRRPRWRRRGRARRDEAENRPLGARSRRDVESLAAALRRVDALDRRVRAETLLLLGLEDLVEERVERLGRQRRHAERM